MDLADSGRTSLAEGAEVYAGVGRGFGMRVRCIAPRVEVNLHNLRVVDADEGVAPSSDATMTAAAVSRAC